MNNQSASQTFNNGLKRIMNEKGITMTDLVASLYRPELGKTFEAHHNSRSSCISRLTNRPHNVTLRTLDVIAEGLGVRPWEILKAGEAEPDSEVQHG
jgi:Cro/C1-type HTH DNA-binding domain